MGVKIARAMLLVMIFGYVIAGFFAIVDVVYNIDDGISSQAMWPIGFLRVFLISLGPVSLTTYVILRGKEVTDNDR